MWPYTTVWVGKAGVSALLEEEISPETMNLSSGSCKKARW
jgi:hypothetical protein